MPRSKASHYPKRIWRSVIANRSSGWMVQYVVDQVMVRKFFSDAVYKTSAKAKAAAEKFAHAHVELHLELLALRRRLQVRKNSTSGITGVARYEQDGGNPYWIAYWDDRDGNKCHRKFSVAKYGERDAKARAVSVRRTAEAKYRTRLVTVRRLLKRTDEGLKRARAQAQVKRATATRRR